MSKKKENRDYTPLSPIEKTFMGLSPADFRNFKFELPPYFIARIDFTSNQVYFKHSAPKCREIFVFSEFSPPKAMKETLESHHKTCPHTVSED